MKHIMRDGRSLIYKEYSGVQLKLGQKNGETSIMTEIMLSYFQMMSAVHLFPTK